jgi:hypothetical protein
LGPFSPVDELFFQSVKLVKCPGTSHRRFLLSRLLQNFKIFFWSKKERKIVLKHVLLCLASDKLARCCKTSFLASLTIRQNKLQCFFLVSIIAKSFVCKTRAYSSGELLVTPYLYWIRLLTILAGTNTLAYFASV